MADRLATKWGRQLPAGWKIQLAIADFNAARCALSCANQLDLLRFQVKEITSAKLVAGEEVELEAEYARASNAARLTELAQTALAALAEDDNALLDQAGTLGRTLQELSRLDTTAQPLVDLQEQAVNTLRDLQRELSGYADGIDIDPARLHELSQRMDVIQSLKRKYGSSVDEVIRFGNDARQKLQALESRDAELERLNGEIEKREAEIWRTGTELTAARKKIIPKLSKAAVKQLSDLGFKQSLLEVQLTSTPRATGSKSPFRPKSSWSMRTRCA